MDLQDFEKRNYIMAIGYYSDPSGINQTNRVFPIVGIYEVDERKILKVRNPWEDFKWNGAYNDSANVWSKKLKESVGFFKGES